MAAASNEFLIKSRLSQLRKISADIGHYQRQLKREKDTRLFLLHALVKSGVSKTQLAKEIGVSRNTLYRILEGRSDA